MRILIISIPFHPTIGGVEATSQQMAATLVELGHQVALLTPAMLHGAAELPVAYSIIRSTMPTRWFAAACQADLVICKGGVLLKGIAAATAARKPYVLVHEMAGSWHGQGPRWMAKLRDYAAKKAALNLGVSQACLDSKNLPPSTPKGVLYNPVPSQLDALASELQATPKTTDILYVGRMIEGKGIFVLADALHRLDALGHPFAARLIGDGPALPELRARLADLKTVAAEAPGAFSGEALAKEYAAARLLVIPTTSHPEGMGLVIAEALTFGLPVIGSDQPAIREVIGDAGIIVRSGDAAELAAAISSLLSPSPQLHSLAENVRRRAPLFSPRSFREDLAQFVLQAAAARQ